MISKKVGRQTVFLENKPRIIEATSVAGVKEGDGPYASYFDIIVSDDKKGQKSFERAESNFLFTAIKESIQKKNLRETDIDYLFSGDLLSQNLASNFAAREFEIPFWGLYGACSTMSESLALAAIFIDGGYGEYTIAATSSHFCSAERQFRFPLEYGGQRKDDAQWTVTGAGAMILSAHGNYPYVSYITTGVIKDYGVSDAEQMGIAMAPSAVDTIYKHFVDTGRNPCDYDIIATGDLGSLGKEMTQKLLLEYGYDISKNYIDFGDIIFDKEKQCVGSGGSGCGCSALMTCSYIYKGLLSGKFKKVLIVSTGALLSSMSIMQGESIPGIAHAVAIEF